MLNISLIVFILKLISIFIKSSNNIIIAVLLFVNFITLVPAIQQALYMRAGQFARQEGRSYVNGARAWC